MSLIEQALRRVQDPVMTTTQTTPPQQQKDAPPESGVHSWKTESPPPLSGSSAAPHTTNALAAVALAVVGLTIVLVVGGAFWMGHTIRNTSFATRPATTEQPAAAPATPEKTASLISPALSRSTRAESDFVLSGVVEGAGNPYAVINGGVVSIGDQVGNATLVAISGSTATVRLANGEQRVLRVAR